MRLWDWTLAAYERPDCPAATLHLQDDHGQNTAYLLWAVWAGATDEALLARAAGLARQWDEAVLWPLRNTRRVLKGTRPGVDDAAREDLREDVKAAELKAEKVLMESLEALAPHPHEADALDALSAAAAVWGGPTPPGDRNAALERLAMVLR